MFLQTLVFTLYLSLFFTDKNECNYKNGGCVHFCHNTKGNYTCSCRDGFELDRGQKDCVGESIGRHSALSVMSRKDTSGVIV